ncbi:hypothetical protein E0L36_20835 [Streptomyces sp. AJS327]|uniref:hypothetical protein n=1 Tax=Streptomyces sp. AJS327 TaxID=2545265 RepID=UPI0015DE8AB4|nr:hypothetical protein [Streptomyces sp. AJS327]MBA0053230.1 hypothetical protein [Streptomyces sp. AJS327]
MTGEQLVRSAYVLEKTYDGRSAWTLFFVYARRAHIWAVLRDMYVDNPDPDVVDGQICCHEEGETADLWLIEGGRRTGHVDLTVFLGEPVERTEPGGSERQLELDRAGFEAAVPAALAGAPLRHGEDLQLFGGQADFRDLDAELPFLYPEHPLHYGMQVWGEGELSDEPYDVFTDPDPDPDPGPDPHPHSALPA